MPRHRPKGGYRSKNDRDLLLKALDNRGYRPGVSYDTSVARPLVAPPGLHEKIGVLAASLGVRVNLRPVSAAKLLDNACTYPLLGQHLIDAWPSEGVTSLPVSVLPEVANTLETVRPNGTLSVDKVVAYATGQTFGILVGTRTNAGIVLAAEHDAVKRFRAENAHTPVVHRVALGTVVSEYVGEQYNTGETIRPILNRLVGGLALSLGEREVLIVASPASQT